MRLQQGVVNARKNLNQGGSVRLWITPDSTIAIHDKMMNTDVKLVK